LKIASVFITLATSEIACAVFPICAASRFQHTVESGSAGRGFITLHQFSSLSSLHESVSAYFSCACTADVQHRCPVSGLSEVTLVWEKVR